MLHELGRPALVAVAIAAMTGAASGGVSDAAHVTTTRGAHRIAASVAIDQNDTFTPPPADAKPRLSADSAWRRYTRQLGHPQPRPRKGVEVWIGEFTSYQAVPKLAYGYEWHQAEQCMTTLPPKHPQLCRSWDFASATTGKSLGSRQQPLPGHQCGIDIKIPTPAVTVKLFSTHHPGKVTVQSGQTVAVVTRDPSRLGARRAKIRGRADVLCAEPATGGRHRKVVVFKAVAPGQATVGTAPRVSPKSGSAAARLTIHVR